MHCQTEVPDRIRGVDSYFRGNGFRVWLQPVTGYLGLTLVSVWHGTLLGGFSCYFSDVFSYYWQNFHFCRGTRRWAAILWGLDTFLIFPNSFTIASLKSLDNSFVNLYIPCLSVIIAHRFTCGERKF